MRLLFDQNISPRILHQIVDIFPDANHVRYMGLEDSSDVKIFEIAKEKGYAIITFDSDYVDLNVVKGFPPKIIWLKTGNLTTKAICELLFRNLNQIKDFLASDEEEILEIMQNAS